MAPDLLRSLAVLHDRREMLYGKELGPLLAAGQKHGFKFSEKELADLSQFLTASINGILRSGYNAQPTNLLSGDAKAGEAYFNGTGGCSKCHSVAATLPASQNVTRWQDCNRSFSSRASGCSSAAKCKSQ